MVSTSLFICLVSALTLVCAKPAPRDLVVLNHLQNVPQGYVKNDATPPTTNLNLRVALVSNNMAGRKKALFDVSTLSSSLYGQYLTKAQVEIRSEEHTSELQSQ